MSFSAFCLSVWFVCLLSSFWKTSTRGDRRTKESNKRPISKRRTGSSFTRMVQDRRKARDQSQRSATIKGISVKFGRNPARCASITVFEGGWNGDLGLTESPDSHCYGPTCVPSISTSFAFLCLLSCAILRADHTWTRLATSFVVAVQPRTWPLIMRVRKLLIPCLSADDRF